MFETPRDLDLRHVTFAGRCPRRRAGLRGAEPARSRQTPEAAGAPREGDTFAAIVLRRNGLDPDAYGERPLQRRTAACLRTVGAADEAEGRRILDERPNAAVLAAEALLIGVTSFFRDRGVWDVLAREVLPQLAQARRTIRVWSVGCANGAELRSVALLLALSGLAGRSRLLGTDCRARAIDAAREGLYTRDELAAVDPGLVRRYFVAAGERFCAGPALRAGIEWRQADVIRGVEPGPWDLVLFRNVAIYMRPAAAAAVGSALRGVVRAGGYLVVGSADTPAARGLPLCAVARCVYRKPAGGVCAPGGRHDGAAG